MSEELQLESIGDRWAAAWTEADRQGFAELCSADVHYEDPVTTEPLAGAQSLADHAEQLVQAFPDIRVERTGPRIATGSYACLPWRFLGTHKGDLGALPATGRFLTLQGLHYVELADGRIRRARGFFDLYAAGIQLGLIPERGSLGETAVLLVRGFGVRPRG